VSKPNPTYPRFPVMSVMGTKEFSLATKNNRSNSSKAGGGKGTGNRFNKGQLKVKQLAQSLQQQQGEIDSLKDLLRKQIEEDEIQWNLDSADINVCELTPSQTSVFEAVTTTIPRALAASAGAIFVGSCARKFSSSNLVAGLCSLSFGVASYVTANYLKPCVTRRELRYRVDRKLVDGDVDMRPSYDLSRSHVSGAIYECTPYIRVFWSDETHVDHEEIRVGDPDYHALIEKGLFRPVSWTVSAAKSQIISAPVVHEVLTRRTLPEIAHKRVRRIVATHDRLCGNTEWLLKTGSSDLRDSSLLCELIVARTIYLNGAGSSDTSYTATVQAIGALILVMPLLNRGLKYLIFMLGLAVSVPPLLPPYLGT